MKKGLLASVLVVLAAVSVHQGSKRVTEFLPMARPVEPDYPEDLPAELKAEPIAKIRKNRLTSNVYAYDGWVVCFGNEPSLEVIEIVPESWWGRRSAEVALPAVPTSVQGCGEVLRIFFEAESPIAFDLSNPPEPRKMEIRSLPSDLKGFIFGEDLAVGFDHGQIHIFSIDSEGSAEEVGVYPTGSTGMGQGFIRDRKLYFCDGWNGFHMVDLTHPFSPAFESLLPFEDAVVDACFVKDHLVVCLQEDKPRVFDWTRGFSSEAVLEMGGEARSCVSHGERVFLGYSRWTHDYDFSDPKNPLLLGVYPGSANYLAFWEDKLLVPRGEDGVWIYDLKRVRPEGA